MVKNNKKLKYFIGLNHFSKFGPVRIKKIENYFPDAETAFGASIKDFTKAGIEEKIASEFISMRKNLSPDKIIFELEKENIKTVCQEDEIYPKLLKEIFDPPPLLYYRGNLFDDHKFSLAIVGSRKSTHYGEQIIEKIIPGLIQNNFTINSGLALGIDSLAHKTTLKSQGKTIAVLGTGIDNKSIYPSYNKKLALEIIENDGALVSEFPPGTPPLRHHFPQRNRIVSGMSNGILVIEAAQKSGALITARLGLEHNREVMAVPGNIFSSASTGPNLLIKEGAKSITSTNDILECFGFDTIKEEKKSLNINLSQNEKLVFDGLGHEPIHIDILIKKTLLNPQTVSSALTSLEIKGLVKNIGYMKYVLN